jgi:hypothetical protein
MKKNKYVLVVAVVAGICLIATAASRAIPDRSRNYDVTETQVNVPEYKTDAARAIDAYERLMERYMDLSEKLISQMGGDCQSVSTKLDSIDTRLTELSTRLNRIEKALGIDPNSGVMSKKLK